MVRRHVRRKTDEVIVHVVGQGIDVILVFVDDLHAAAVVIEQQIHRVGYRVARQTRHGGNRIVRAGQRQCRRGEELLIQLLKLAIHALADLLVVLDEPAGQLFELHTYGQQHHGGDQAEQRVHVGDAAGGNRAIPECVQRAEIVQQRDAHDHENGRADVEDDVHHTGALRVGLGADGADDGRRHTVADVHADDDGVNRAQRQRAGDGQRL